MYLTSSLDRSILWKRNFRHFLFSLNEKETFRLRRRRRVSGIGISRFRITGFLKFWKRYQNSFLQPHSIVMHRTLFFHVKPTRRLTMELLNRNRCTTGSAQKSNISIWNVANQVQHQKLWSVWPDLAKFHHFGKLLKNLAIYLRFTWFWAFLFAFLVLLKLNHFWQTRVINFRRNTTAYHLWQFSLHLLLIKSSMSKPHLVVHLSHTFWHRKLDSKLDLTSSNSCQSFAKLKLRFF